MLVERWLGTKGSGQCGSEGVPQKQNSRAKCSKSASINYLYEEARNGGSIQGRELISVKEKTFSAIERT